MQHESREHTALSPGISASSPSASSKKRKSTNPTSRGVATLTAEQLTKKRANDREAQRAIRERTKSQIERLERQIQDLTSQQPYQELQVVIRQKDAVQAENEEIRRRLASIMSIVQPVVGAQGLTAAQTNLQLGLAQNANLFSQDHYDGHNTNDHSPHSMATEGQAAYSQPYGGGEGMTENERMWQSSRHALDDQRNNIHRGLELNDSERLSFNFLLDGTKKLQPRNARGERTSPGQQTSSAAGSTYSGQPQTSWTTLPRNIAPTCPLDGILLKFLQTRQHEVGSGASQNSLAEPAYPRISSLLNPASGCRVDPLSQLMADIISKFPAICGLPEQVAIIYQMFLLMRWMIYPTQANYERLPDWLTPRPSQLFTPHPAWLDYLPWPRLRDRLVDTYTQYPFENWFIPFTTGLSVNWPYEPTDCLLSALEDDESTINPVFERHVMRLENWSVGPVFVEAFPTLAGTVNVRHDQGMRGAERPP